MTREEIDWLNSSYKKNTSISSNLWKQDRDVFLKDNKMTYCNYLEFAYYTSILVDKLSDGSSISKANILSKLLSDGTFSVDNNFKFDTVTGNCTMKFGIAIINGNGCCRHIADFTNDVLNMSNERTYLYPCMINDKVLDVSFLDSGDHIANVIYYEGIPYVYDEWSNSLLRFISDRIAFLPGSNSYMNFIPYILSTYYGFSNEEIIKMITDFENASRTRQISRMEFVRINNESNKSIDRNSNIIHNFKTKTKSLKKSISEGYKR